MGVASNTYMHELDITIPDFQPVRGTGTAPPPLPLGGQECPGTGYSQDYEAV